MAYLHGIEFRWDLCLSNGMEWDVMAYLHGIEFRWDLCLYNVMEWESWLIYMTLNSGGIHVCLM